MEIHWNVSKRTLSWLTIAFIQKVLTHFIISTNQIILLNLRFWCKLEICLTIDDVLKFDSSKACKKCQFGCGISKMVGPKKQAFCPRINVLKGNCFETILQWIVVCQKVTKSYFQSQFSMSKIDRFFSKKNHLRISI